MASNDRAGIQFTQPKTFEERIGIAAACQTALQIDMPLVVDTLDDKVELAYGAFPDRLYLIDPRGKVAFKGGRGPFGYEPEKLERSLIMLLLDESLDTPKPSPKTAKKGAPSTAKPKKKPASKKPISDPVDKAPSSPSLPQK